MTLRHIVSWKLEDDDRGTAPEKSARIHELLGALPPVIEEIRAWDVVTNVVSTPASHDLALVADFDDVDALGRYQVHPDHQRAAAEIGTLVSGRTVLDYEV